MPIRIAPRFIAPISSGPLGGHDRARDLEDDVGLAQRRGLVRHDARTGVGESLVRDRCAGAGACLDEDLEPQALEPLHGVRRHGDARLVRAALLGNGELHAESAL
jgi:hypothetical protein